MRLSWHFEILSSFQNLSQDFRRMDLMFGKGVSPGSSILTTASNGNLTRILSETRCRNFCGTNRKSVARTLVLFIRQAHPGHALCETEALSWWHACCLRFGATEPKLVDYPVFCIG
jgi:hypothetical protein